MTNQQQIGIRAYARKIDGQLESATAMCQMCQSTLRSDGLLYLVSAA